MTKKLTNKGLIPLMGVALFMSMITLGGFWTQSSTVEARLLAKAEDGDVAAQIQLAINYEIGQEGPFDLYKAEKWYRTAADKGNAYGKHSLARMYCFRRFFPHTEITVPGPTLNYEEGYFWATLAATSTDRKSYPILAYAEDTKNECKAHLTKEQMTVIEARAKEWKPAAALKP